MGRGIEERERERDGFVWVGRVGFGREVGWEVKRREVERGDGWREVGFLFSVLWGPEGRKGERGKEKERSADGMCEMAPLLLYYFTVLYVLSVLLRGWDGVPGRFRDREMNVRRKTGVTYRPYI